MLSIDWNVLWIIVNLLVLFLLLKKFLFKPVTKMMDEREAKIKADIDNAKAQNDAAAELKANYEQSLKDAHNEAVVITNNAKDRASKEANVIIDNAKEQSSKILSDAQKNAALEKEKALKSAKTEIADLTLLAATKVIKKEVDEETDKEIALDFLSEVGADQWFTNVKKTAQKF